jgi:hypothetical protein
MKLRERPCGGLIAGELPEGCRLCEQGAKMVLFVTGLCAYHCAYCPVSEARMYRDVVFANERRVERDEDVLVEARAMRAGGAGITGGDPLEVAERVARYIRLLKGEFGASFQTHLYTMTTDLARIRTVALGGLDEIRFHPPPGLWRRLETSGYPAAVAESRRLGMAVGLEVPLIPDRRADLEALLDWAEASRLDFVNLNELEFSEANFGRLHVQGYRMKDELAYGVVGSDEAAEAILGRRRHVTVHYCTSGYKDAWQLRERFKRAAATVAKPWDVVTEDGTLLKGIVEAADPSAVARVLQREHGVPARLVHAEPDRRRVEVAPWVLEAVSSSLAWPSFLVEEHPTAERLEVERQRLPGR